MTAKTEQEQDAEQKRQEQNTELRKDIAQAYTSLLADQTTKGFAAFTFEEALDAQIERIEGAGTQVRPNLLDRVSRITSRVVQAVEQIKKLPPETFRKPDSKDDVNTATDPDEGDFPPNDSGTAAV
jgi:hypothetical protein